MAKDTKDYTINFTATVENLDSVISKLDGVAQKLEEIGNIKSNSSSTTLKEQKKELSEILKLLNYISKDNLDLNFKSSKDAVLAAKQQAEHVEDLTKLYSQLKQYQALNAAQSKQFESALKNQVSVLEQIIAKTKDFGEALGKSGNSKLDINKELDKAINKILDVNHKLIDIPSDSAYAKFLENRIKLLDQLKAKEEDVSNALTSKPLKTKPKQKKDYDWDKILEKQKADMRKSSGINDLADDLENILKSYGGKHKNLEFSIIAKVKDFNDIDKLQELLDTISQKVGKLDDQTYTKASDDQKLARRINLLQQERDLLAEIIEYSNKADRDRLNSVLTNYRPKTEVTSKLSSEELKKELEADKKILEQYEKDVAASTKYASSKPVEDVASAIRTESMRIQKAQAEVAKKHEKVPEQIQNEISKTVNGQQVIDAIISVKGYQASSVKETLIKIQEYFDNNPITVRFSAGSSATLKDTKSYIAAVNEVIKRDLNDYQGSNKLGSDILLVRQLNEAINKSNTLQESLKYLENHLFKGDNGKYLQDIFSDTMTRKTANALGKMPLDTYKAALNSYNALKNLTEDEFKAIKDAALGDKVKFGITIDDSKLFELKRNIEQYFNEHKVQLPIGLEELYRSLSGFENKFNFLFRRLTGDNPVIDQKTKDSSIIDVASIDKQIKKLDRLNTMFAEGKVVKDLVPLLSSTQYSNFEKLIVALLSLGNAAKHAYDYVKKLSEVNIKLISDRSDINSVVNYLKGLPADINKDLIFVPSLNDTKVKPFLDDMDKRLAQIKDNVKNIFGGAGEGIGLDPNSRNKIRVTVDKNEIAQVISELQAIAAEYQRVQNMFSVPLKPYITNGEGSTGAWTVLTNLIKDYEYLRTDKLVNQPLVFYGKLDQNLKTELDSLKNYHSNIDIDFKFVLPHQKIADEITKLEKDFGMRATNFGRIKNLDVFDKLSNKVQSKSPELANLYQEYKKALQSQKDAINKAVPNNITLKLTPEISKSDVLRAIDVSGLNTPKIMEVVPKLTTNPKALTSFIDDLQTKIKNVPMSVDVTLKLIDYDTVEQKLKDLRNILGGTNGNSQFKLQNTDALAKIKAVRQQVDQVISVLNKNKVKVINVHIASRGLTKQVNSIMTKLNSGLNFDSLWSNLGKYLGQVATELRTIQNPKADFSQVTAGIKALKTSANTFYVRPLLLPRAVEDVIRKIRTDIAAIKNLPHVDVEIRLNKGIKTKVVNEVKDIIKQINNVPRSNDIQFTTNAGMIIKAVESLANSIQTNIQSISSIATNPIAINITANNLDTIEQALGKIAQHLRDISNLRNTSLNGLPGGSGGGNPPSGGNPLNAQWQTYRQKVTAAILEADKQHQLWKSGQGSQQDYDKAHKDFADALKAYLEFSRSLGTMSFASQISELEKLAASASRDSKEFKELAEQIRQLGASKNQLYNDLAKKPVSLVGALTKDDFRSKGNKFSNSTANSVITLSGMPGFMESGISRTAYGIRLFGRASKGIGSAGEAISQFMIDIQRVVELSRQRADYLREKINGTTLVIQKLTAELFKLGTTSEADIKRRAEIRGQLNELYSLRARATKEIGDRTKDVRNFTVVGNVINTLTHVAAVVGVLEKAIEWPVRGLQYFGNMLQQVGQQIYNALKPGLELYKLQQGAMFSFAASFMSNAKIGGQAPDKGLALGLSKQLVERATLDAEMSAFSLEEILRSLQGTMPLLLNLGMNADQAYEINKGVAGVAKMIQLTPSQILQETRDLAQGSITSRGSQVANALGITNEDLNKFGSDAEARFRFLMEKFKNFSELLNDYEDTFEGRWQQLQERWQKTTMTVVEEIAPLFKGLFEDLITLTGKYVDDNGNYLDAITGEWKTAAGEVIASREDIATGGGYAAFGIGDPHFQLSEELVTVKDALVDIISYIASILDGMVEWAKVTFNLRDSGDGVKDAIDLAVVGVKTLINFMARLVKWVVKLLQRIYNLGPALAVVYNTFIGILNIVSFIVNGILLVTELLSHLDWTLGGRTGKMDAKGNITWDDETEEGRKEYNKYLKNRASYVQAMEDAWSSERVGSIFDTSSDGLTAKGFFTEASEKYKGKSTDGSEKAEATNGKTLKDLQGTYSKANKDQEKILKKAIQELQKVYKNMVSSMKDVLDSSLAKLKELNEKNDLDYKQGLKSFADYYADKAGLEVEEKRQQLAMLQEQQVMLDQTPFENSYEATKEQMALTKQIQAAEREYNKAIAGQQDVLKLTGKITTVQTNTDTKMRETAQHFRKLTEESQKLEENTSKLLDKQVDSFGKVETSMSSAKGFAEDIANSLRDGADAIRGLAADVSRTRDFAGNTSHNNIGLNDSKLAALYNTISLSSKFGGQELSESQKYVVTEMVKFWKAYDVEPIVRDIMLSNAVYESGLNTGAYNSSGATGLMQFLPGTAASLSEKYWSGKEPLDPAKMYDSFLLAMFYIRQIIDSVNDLPDTDASNLKERVILSYWLGEAGAKNWNFDVKAAQNLHGYDIDLPGRLALANNARMGISDVLADAIIKNTSEEKKNTEATKEVTNVAKNNSSKIPDDKNLYGVDRRYYYTEKGDGRLRLGYDPADDIGKLQDFAKAGFNALNELFYDKTGYLLEPNVATSGQHSEGSAHYVGYAVDYQSEAYNPATGEKVSMLAAENDLATKLVEAANELGIAISLEDKYHWHALFGDTGKNQIPKGLGGFDTSGGAGGLTGSKWQKNYKSGNISYHFGDKVPGAAYSDKQKSKELTDVKVDPYRQTVMALKEYASADMFVGSPLYNKLLREPMTDEKGFDIQQKILDELIRIYDERIALTPELDIKTMTELRKIREQLKQDKNRIIANQSPFPNDAKQLLEARRTKEELDAATATLERMFDYIAAADDTWQTFAYNKAWLGKGGFEGGWKEVMRRYSKYYYNDVKNPLAPAYVISQMWEKAKEYAAAGHVMKAQEIRQKIVQFYDRLNQKLQEYLDRVNDFFSKYSEWLSNTWTTSLQKERGEREIKARQGQANYNAAEAQLRIIRGYGEGVYSPENLKKSIDEYNAKIKIETDPDSIKDLMEHRDRFQRLYDESGGLLASIQKLLREDQEEAYKLQAAIAELDKDDAESAKLNMNLRAVQENIALREQLEQQLELRKQTLEYQKLQAEQQSKINDYILRTQQVSKQALEDGLVTFLTDGVNEAESLGDALRDLAVTYLKTMQKYFAQEMVTDMMTKWFPLRREEYGYGEQGKYDEFALRMGYDKIFHDAGLDNRFGDSKALPLTSDAMGREYFRHMFGGDEWEAQRRAEGWSDKKISDFETKWGKELLAQKGQEALVEMSREEGMFYNKANRWLDRELANSPEQDVDKNTSLGKQGVDKVVGMKTGANVTDMSGVKSDTVVQASEVEVTTTGNGDIQIAGTDFNIGEKAKYNFDKNDWNLADAKTFDGFDKHTATLEAATVAQEANTIATNANTSQDIASTTQEATNDAQKLVVDEQQVASTQQLNATLTSADGHLVQLTATNQSKALTEGVGGSVATSPPTLGTAPTLGNNAGFTNFKMGNLPVFGNIMSSINGIFGSALGQLAGAGNAISAIVSGDSKERLLGTIYMELELIYTTLTTMSAFLFSSLEQFFVSIKTIETLLAQYLPSINTSLNTTQDYSGVTLSKGGVIHASKGFTFANRYNGLVSGPGTSTSDDIPAMLSNGEAVLNAKAVRQLGVNFINAVNNGDFAKIRTKIPHFAKGGVLGDAQQSTARGMSGFAQNIGTSVSTTNNMNVALVRDEQEAMSHFMRSPQGQRILCDFSRGNGRVFARFNN